MDFNPGITVNGLFWTAAVDPGDVEIEQDETELEVDDLLVPDYHDLVNALSGGPSVSGVVDFEIEWAHSFDRRFFHDPVNRWAAEMSFTTAKCEWKGETATAKFKSEDNDLSVSLFAEIGRERNGVFFG